jgi:chitinase
MQAYLDANVAATKLVVGFPAYGRALSGVDNAAPTNQSTAYGLYQTFTGVPQGEWDATGVFDYKYIVSNMLGKGFTAYHDTNAGATAAYNASTSTWISFDSVQDVKDKADFVKAHNFAGMMVWSLSGDAPVTDPASLVAAANNQLNN